jgi:alkanesulfonate monooxygenase SsuD/methylene tetrahydromethanopterin reductase-like flavin-dependent oxidoreductase (luciferase family)
VAETSRQASGEFFPAYASMMNRIGRERGWQPMTRPQFDALRSPQGALLVGSPEQVAEKIVAQHELFGHDRFLAQMALGDLSHDRAMRSIELFGAEVAPLVRQELSSRSPERAPEEQPARP